MGKQDEGYVDYYYGPSEIKERVDEESSVPAKQLLRDCSSLQKRVFDQGFDKKREIYLAKMLKAIELYLKKEFLGEKIIII